MATLQHRHNLVSKQIRQAPVPLQQKTPKVDDRAYAEYLADDRMTSLVQKHNAAVTNADNAKFYKFAGSLVPNTFGMQQKARQHYHEQRMKTLQHLANIQGMRLGQSPQYTEPSSDPKVIENMKTNYADLLRDLKSSNITQNAVSTARSILNTLLNDGYNLTSADLSSVEKYSTLSLEVLQNELILDSNDVKDSGNIRNIEFIIQSIMKTVGMLREYADQPIRERKFAMQSVKIEMQNDMLDPENIQSDVQKTEELLKIRLEISADYKKLVELREERLKQRIAAADREQKAENKVLQQIRDEFKTESEEVIAEIDDIITNIQDADNEYMDAQRQLGLWEDEIAKFDRELASDADKELAKIQEELAKYAEMLTEEEATTKKIGDSVSTKLTNTEENIREGRQASLDKLVADYDKRIKDVEKDVSYTKKERAAQIDFFNQKKARAIDDHNKKTNKMIESQKLKVERKIVDTAAKKIRESEAKQATLKATMADLGDLRELTIKAVEKSREIQRQRDEFIAANPKAALVNKNNDALRQRRVYEDQLDAAADKYKINRDLMDNYRLKIASKDKIVKSIIQQRTKEFKESEEFNKRVAKALEDVVDMVEAATGSSLDISTVAREGIEPLLSPAVEAEPVTGSETVEAAPVFEDPMGIGAYPVPLPADRARAMPPAEALRMGDDEEGEDDDEGDDEEDTEEKAEPVAGEDEDGDDMEKIYQMSARQIMSKYDLKVTDVKAAIERKAKDKQIKKVLNKLQQKFKPKARDSLAASTILREVGKPDLPYVIDVLREYRALEYILK